MKKIETLALLVAAVGVGMAIFYTKGQGSGNLVKTQYGQGWSDGPSSVQNMGSGNGTIWV